MVYLQNPVLLNNFLITFEFSLPDYTPIAKQCYTGCLSGSAVTKFKKTLNPVTCFNVSDDSLIYFSSSQTDHLVDTTAGSLRMTLDSIAPLKKKLMKQRKQYVNSEV